MKIQKKLKKIILPAIILILTACVSQVLPDKDTNLKSYISATQNTNNANQEQPPVNFPQDCKWHQYNRHVDGDTIIIDKNTRVRFLGVDTPETKKANTEIQKYGPEASQFTKKSLKDAKKVCLIYSQSGNTQDKYGRKLAYIFTESGFDLNAELLKNGLAKVYMNAYYDRKNEFINYQKEAKSKKINLWE